MFNDKDNANKVPALLQEIYSKVAGESADMGGIAEYSNDTKVSMLLERIATALEGGGGSTGGGSMLVTIPGGDVATKRFDKTAGEVINALNSGTIVRFVSFKETEDPSPEGHGLWTNYTLSTWSVYTDETPTGEGIAFELIEFDYTGKVIVRAFICSSLDDYPELYVD